MWILINDDEVAAEDFEALDDQLILNPVAVIGGRVSVRIKSSCLRRVSYPSRCIGAVWISNG
jgi:hypothetical protein